MSSEDSIFFYLKHWRSGHSADLETHLLLLSQSGVNLLMAIAATRFLCSKVLAGFLLCHSSWVFVLMMVDKRQEVEHWRDLHESAGYHCQHHITKKKITV